jgi:hypothetical protein
MLARLLLLDQVISRSTARPAKGDQMDVLGKNPLRVGLTVAICLGAIVGLVGCDRRTAAAGAGNRLEGAEAAPFERPSPFARTFAAGDIGTSR